MSIVFEGFRKRFCDVRILFGREIDRLSPFQLQRGALHSRVLPSAFASILFSGSSSTNDYEETLLRSARTRYDSRNSVRLSNGFRNANGTQRDLSDSSRRSSAVRISSNVSQPEQQLEQGGVAVAGLGAEAVDRESSADAAVAERSIGRPERGRIDRRPAIDPAVGISIRTDPS